MPVGEVSGRESIRLGKCPVGEISVGEVSVGEVSVGEVSGNQNNSRLTLSIYSFNSKELSL